MPTRSEIRAFGRKVRRGDVFVNRFEEHGRPPFTRQLVVTLDIRRTALFVLEDADGKSTVMRSRTLMTRYLARPDRGFIRDQD